MSYPQNLEVNWDIIVETIKAERCILFIGPELFTNPEGVSLEQQLFEYLGVDEDPGIKVYDDALFFFKELSQKTLTYYQIKSFYKSEFPRTEALFEKIARIPFHFIISITPDTRLSEVYDRLSIKHKFDFYWKNHAADPNVRVPNRDNPMVYNFFGSIDRQESLVLTHDDLFDFFDSIFQGKSLSPNLKHHLMREADNFVFLGMHFDKWYVQLLLRFLHLHKDQEFVKYAFNQSLDDEICTLCYDHFRINFIPNKMETFIDEIYARCEAEGILRRPGEEKASIVDQLKQWMAQDEIDRVLKGFLAFLEEMGDQGLDLFDDVVLLKNRYRRLNKKINMNVIEESEANVESNKIRKSLLDLLNEARAFE